MARLLMNENVPLESVFALRQAGHDVLSISEACPGVSDEIVLQRAASEDRLLVTFDKDYGELIYRRRLPPPSSVIYLRAAPLNPMEVARRLIPLLTDPRIRLKGMFTVIDPDSLRQRPFPLRSRKKP